MKNNQNILVIGAGIAGPTICYWLKKYGFTPTLIERSKQLRTGGYAIDIRGTAVDIVKKMDIYDDLFEKRTSLSSRRYVNAHGQTLLEKHGEEASFRQDDDFEILRGELVNILLDAIPDIPCYFDQEIISLTQTKRFVEVTFKNGKVKRYDLVIAADGLHSKTRGLAFSDEEYRLLNLGSYISIFSIPNYLNLNRAEVSFSNEHKFIGIHSDKNPDRAFVCFAVHTAKPLNDAINEEEQKKYLEDLFYDLGWESNRILELMKGCHDFYFDAIAQIKMDSWTKGRVALLGDAGYCASPLSGQGTNLAIIGAYILAGELSLAEGDYAVAFKRYHALMHPLVNTVQDLGAWVGKHYLSEVELSKESLEQRSAAIMEKIQAAANAIPLLNYKR